MQVMGDQSNYCCTVNLLIGGNKDILRSSIQYLDSSQPGFPSFTSVCPWIGAMRRAGLAQKIYHVKCLT